MQVWVDDIEDERKPPAAPAIMQIHLSTSNLLLSCRVGRLGRVLAEGAQVGSHPEDDDDGS